MSNLQDSVLFTPYRLGQVTLRNRTIRSAAFESMGKDFSPTQQLKDYTAGGDFHPAPKTNMRLFSTHMIHHAPPECNCFLQNACAYQISTNIY